MRSFRKTGKVLICAVVFLGILLFMDLLLYPCTYLRNDVHAVLTEHQDVLFLGTSNGKMGIDPDVALEGTGLSGHNLCSGGEYPVDAYYLLKLAIEKQKPEMVVYEVFPSYFLTEKEQGNNYGLFYHEFPISAAKAEYFFSTMTDCDFRSLLFPFYEYSLKDTAARIPSTVWQKMTRNYDISYLEGEEQAYHENGFIERFPVAVEDFPAYSPYNFSADAVVGENVEYLKKIIALCRENDVTFIAISMPQADPVLAQYKESFDAAWVYFSDFFTQEGVPYYNFNDEYYAVYPHTLENYVDYNGHLDGAHAEEFSATLGKILFPE